MRRAIVACLLFSACHWTRYDAKPTTPTQMCHACCQQAQDACKLDNDHPAYYCPRDYQECVTACDAGDENQICVTQTKQKVATTAPPPHAIAAAKPAAAVAKVAPSARGECDTRGTWQLVISEAKGRGASCTSLEQIPRQVSFRIERHHDEFALDDLAPAPGWSDGFSVDNAHDACGVTLTRDNAVDAERPRRMTVTMTEKNGEVLGTFHYREQLPMPAACELDATVTGMLIAPAPAPAPPPAAPPPPRPERIEPPKRGAGGGR
jgi:hypothetical protein